MTTAYLFGGFMGVSFAAIASNYPQYIEIMIFAYVIGFLVCAYIDPEHVRRRKKPSVEQGQDHD